MQLPDGASWFTSWWLDIPYQERKPTPSNHSSQSDCSYNMEKSKSWNVKRSCCGHHVSLCPHTHINQFWLLSMIPSCRCEITGRALFTKTKLKVKFAFFMFLPRPKAVMNNNIKLIVNSYNKGGIRFIYYFAPGHCIFNGILIQSDRCFYRHGNGERNIMPESMQI